MSTVLLLGASGQVGRAVRRTAPLDATIVAPTSTELDLRNPAALRAAVAGARVSVVINCAAFTRVDDAETARDDAHAINGIAPGVLAHACAAQGARMVHISTDYVFDGAASQPYLPEARPAPLNAYGESKLAGETAVLESGANSAILRTAWVHSSTGANFVATAVRKLRAGEPMRVVDDQLGTPTRALHLAGAIWAVVQRPAVRGVFHFTDAGVASWYDVAHCVLETLRAVGVAGADALVHPIPTRELTQRARRPAFSVLDKHASWSALGVTPRHWRDGVVATVRELVADAALLPVSETAE